MPKKRRPWFMLLLALTSGVVAALLALRYLRERTTPLMASEPRTASIVLSARNLPVGALVTERDLKVVSWPGTTVPSGYIRSVKDAVGRGVITPVAENEPLIDSKMSTKDAGGGLPIIIRDGMRAMSVRVDEIIGVAGFVLPGTRVDVLLTLDKNGGDRPQSITKTLLQNVQTLAAGQSVTRDKEGKPQTVTVITLLVSPDNAELLALASKEGRLQLALRNTLDTLAVSTNGARADKLSPSGSPAPNRPQRTRAAAPVPRANPTVVEGYRGGERTLTTFQKP